MNKNLSRSWFVAITLVTGFALASCGGGGSNLTPLEQALAERDAVQVALEAAEAATMAAEQRVTEAEAATMVAEAATMVADDARAEADRLRIVADDARAEADRLRMVADADALQSMMEADAAEQRAEEAATAQAKAATAQAKAEEERDAANKRVEVAEAARDSALVTASYTEAKNNSDQAKDAYVAAMAAYGREDADVTKATDLVTSAEAAQTAANTAQSVAADGTEEQRAEAANAVTVAAAAVDAAGDELDEAMMTAAAMPYDMAIRMPVIMPEISATAARTGDDVTVDVLPGGDEDEDDVSDVGAGWYRVDVENEDDSDETATVYTDIENTMMLFSVVNTALKNSIIDSVAETGVLTLESEITPEQLDDLNDLAKSGDFPHSPDGELTITYDDATDSEHKQTFSGTFDNVPGDFSCDAGADGCTITADADGDITGLVGTWTFIPDYLGEDNESMAGDKEDQVASRKDDLTEPMVEVVDQDHLVFGWWTKVNEDDDSVAFQTFSGGMQVYPVGDIGSLEGSATYKGPAAGRYAVKTFTGNAKINSIREGEFTAKAELTATFGGNNVALNKQGMISGRIHTFLDENNKPLLGELDLGLGAHSVVGLGDGDVTGGVGGSPAVGTWSGQFFGIPDVDAADDHPNSVAGEFDASSSHGAVAGAYGATKVEE